MQSNVVEWLNNTARVYPEKIAIKDEAVQLTYKQYHNLSETIAEKLIDAIPGKGNPVAVYLPKSANVLVSFIGIAKSGNFYSPIDVKMPPSRVKKILEILKPNMVITTKALRNTFHELGYIGKYFYIDEIKLISEKLWFSETVKIRLGEIISTDLLYVLFTSGSTGIPKGVCISHGSVIDYTDVITKSFAITDKDCFGNQAPFYFDNSILDIYCSMKMGAELNIIPDKLFSQPVLLLEYLRDNHINTIFWVPSALIIVSKLKALRNVDMTGVLKRVMFCGEVMPNKQLNIWRRFLPNAVYANIYGPTEITDACTMYIVDRKFKDDEPLPIGKAMNNTEIILLDDNDQLITEAGQPGELCVRGIGVAAGYYNNSEKTKSAFVQNPLNSVYEERIYRTGDIVSYNNRGEIIYHSRKDYQIKHMGHRIELGEIETAVSAIEGITLCCCLYDYSRSKIILFIDRDIKKENINEILANMVPEYMLPDKVIFLNNFPLNQNGKIDRVVLKEMMSTINERRDV